MQIDAPVVNGTIIFTATAPAFRSGTVHVYLEDVSYADAGALILAEHIIHNVHHDASRSEMNETTIHFSIDTQAIKIDPKRDYGVRVWVDIDSDGQPAANDLFSWESLRVLTHGFGHTVKARLG